MPRNAVSEALGEGLGGVDALPVDDSIGSISCLCQIPVHLPCSVFALSHSKNIS